MTPMTDRQLVRAIADEIERRQAIREHAQHLADQASARASLRLALLYAAALIPVIGFVMWMNWL